MNKSLRRITPILSNGFRSVITPFLSIIFSYIIVNYFSKQLWGEFVTIFLTMLIAAIISNWGNKDFLLRNFSKNPKRITQNWQELFLARIPILIVFIIYFSIFYNSDIIFWLVVWLFSAFITNSFSPVIIYNRDFTKSVIIELIGFVALILLLFSFKKFITIINLVQFFAIHHLLKAILFTFLYNSFFRIKKFQINFKLLLSSGIFFLLSISGFLQLKIDVYVLRFYTDVILLGEYQIISNFLVFSMTIPTIIVLPYVKNIYRISSHKLLKIRNFMAKIGVLIQFLVTIIIFYILKYFFDIQLNKKQIFAIFLAGLPIYIYLTYVYNLYKHKTEIMVLQICIIAVCLNLVLSIIFLKLNFGITGLLYVSVFVQTISLIYYSKFKINDTSS